MRTDVRLPIWEDSWYGPCGGTDKANCKEDSLPERLEAWLFSAHPYCLGCKAEIERMEEGDGWGEGAELPSAG